MVRKIPQGEFRDKERTKMKLIEAVGEVIRTEGYTKLGVNRIADTAGVSKKLIYRYFGSADNLIETYVKNKDYWMAFRDTIGELADGNRDNDGRRVLAKELKNLYEHLSESSEAQKIILWEISEKSRLMREVSNAREDLGANILAFLDPFFGKTDVDIRAVLALLLGGVYYVVLHSSATGGSFCGIGTDMPERKARLFKGLDDILDWAWAEAGRQRKLDDTGEPAI